MDKNRRVSIIVVAAIIIVFVIISIIVMIKKSKDNNEEVPFDPEPNEALEYYASTANKVKSANSIGDYNIPKRILNKFYASYMDMYNDASRKKVVLDSLGREYKESLNLTEENILEVLPKKENLDITIIDEYVIEDYESKKIYLVDADFRNTATNDIEKNRIIIILDINEYYYSIYLDDYVQQMGLDKLEEGAEIKLALADPEKNPIEKTVNNKYAPGSYTKQNYVTDLFDGFRKLLLYNPSRAYEFLNEGQFNSYEEFQAYLTENRRNIIMMSLDNYKTSYENDKSVYICDDKNGVFKITFNMKSAVKYTYTIEKIQ